MTATAFLSLSFISLVMGVCYDRPVLFPNRRATGAQIFELNPQKDVSTLVKFESKLPHQIASANKKSTDLFLNHPTPNMLNKSVIVYLCLHFKFDTKLMISLHKFISYKHILQLKDIFSFRFQPCRILSENYSK